MQEYIPFFQAEKRSIAEKLAKYFNYSGLETKIHFDEEKDSYILSVPSEKEKEAKKHYQAFYFVERDRIEMELTNEETLENYDESNILSETSLEEMQSINEEIASSNEESTNAPMEADTNDANYELSEEATDSDTSFVDENTEASQYTARKNDDISSIEAVSDVSDKTDDADDNNTPTDILEDEKSAMKRLMASSGSYVMKSEKYKDYKSTQYVFLLLGVAGIVFVILNFLEILSVLNGLFPNIIMGALFICFIFIGISTGKKAKQLRLEIDEETQLTEKINEWLRTTVTDEFLASIKNTELSDELDYIQKTDTIREMLIKDFGDQDRDYLDRLIEEFYTEAFDKSNEYIELDDQ